jgi:hypothetical protein
LPEDCVSLRARFAVAVLISCVTIPLAAQDSTKTPETEAESRARIARRAAGLTVGTWELRGLEPDPSIDVSTMPLITGFLRKGLDARLALENSVGVWRRVQKIEETGGIGGTPGEEVQSWVIAQTTALRFFPVTDAGSRFEPWVLGGAGITIGVDDRQTDGGGLLGGAAGGSGVAMVPGFSLQGGAGVEWWFSTSFALNAGARYQWTRFLQDFGGERTYQGPAYELGLTYKFRYN